MSYRRNKAELPQVKTVFDLMKGLDLQKLKDECAALAEDDLVKFRQEVKESVGRMVELGEIMDATIQGNADISVTIKNTVTLSSSLGHLAYLMPYLTQVPALSNPRALWVADRSLFPKLYYKLPLIGVPEKLQNPLEMWIDLWERRYRQVYGDDFSIDRQSLMCSSDLDLLQRTISYQSSSQNSVIKGIFIEAYPKSSNTALLNSSATMEWLSKHFEPVGQLNYLHEPMLRSTVGEYVNQSPRLFFVTVRDKVDCSTNVKGLGYPPPYEMREFGQCPTFAQALIYHNFHADIFPQRLSSEKRQDSGLVLKSWSYTENQKSRSRIKVLGASPSFNASDESDQAIRLI